MCLRKTIYSDYHAAAFAHHFTGTILDNRKFFCRTISRYGLSRNKNSECVEKRVLVYRRQKHVAENPDRCSIWDFGIPDYLYSDHHAANALYANEEPWL